MHISPSLPHFHSHFIPRSSMQAAPATATAPATPMLSLSSSFSTFTRTNHHLAQTADRVVKELLLLEEDQLENEEDEEFEFPSILTRSCSSPVPADEIFCNGQIRPIYSYDFQRNGNHVPPAPPTPPPVRRQQLRMLFLEESNSSSSSESSSVGADNDDRHGIPPESYCELVTPPKTADGRGNKSMKSRWRLMNILNRSRSSGDDGGKGRGVFPMTSDEILHPHGKRRGEKPKRNCKCHGGVAVDVDETVGEVRRR